MSAPEVEPLTEAERARTRIHLDYGPGYCGCPEPWPCSTARLLVTIDQSTARVAALEAAGRGACDLADKFEDQVRALRSTIEAQASEIKMLRGGQLAVYDPKSCCTYCGISLQHVQAQGEQIRTLTEERDAAQGQAAEAERELNAAWIERDIARAGWKVSNDKTEMLKKAAGGYVCTTCHMPVFENTQSCSVCDLREELRQANERADAAGSCGCNDKLVEENQRLQAYATALRRQVIEFHDVTIAGLRAELSVLKSGYVGGLVESLRAEVERRGKACRCGAADPRCSFKGPDGSQCQMPSPHGGQHVTSTDWYPQALSPQPADEKQEQGTCRRRVVLDERNELYIKHGWLWTDCDKPLPCPDHPEKQ